MPSSTPNPVTAPGFVVFHLAPVKSNHIEVDGRCSMQTAKNDLKHMQRWLHWPQPFGENTIRCRQREIKRTAISKTKKTEKLNILASRWVCYFERFFSLTKLRLTRVVMFWPGRHATIESEKVRGFWSKELYSHSHALRIPQTNAMQLPPFAHCYTQSCKRSTSPQKRLKHRSSKCLALNHSGYRAKYIHKCSIYISHLLIWIISWWCDLFCTQLSLSCRHDHSLRSGTSSICFHSFSTEAFSAKLTEQQKQHLSPRNSILWYFLLPHVSQQYQSMLPFQS